ncbi:MAG: hypothetical protein IT459_15760 [Planctomycetes bacterium]|nr:hypothetical protein [Planctomycetota bacterium]
MDRTDAIVLALLIGSAAERASSSIRDRLRELVAVLATHVPEIEPLVRVRAYQHPAWLGYLTFLIERHRAAAVVQVAEAAQRLFGAIRDHASAVIEGHGLTLRDVHALSLSLYGVKAGNKTIGIADSTFSNSISIYDVHPTDRVARQVALNRVRARHLEYAGLPGRTDFDIRNSLLETCNFRGGGDVYMKDVRVEPRGPIHQDFAMQFTGPGGGVVIDGLQMRM